MVSGAKSSGLSLCEQVQQFMQGIWAFQLERKDPGLVPIPTLLTAELVTDCYLAVEVILIACKGRNTYETPWTIEALRAWRRRGRPGKGMARAEMLYPSPDMGREALIDRPCNVRDSNGRIFCYVLPGLLSPPRQNQLQSAIYNVTDALDKPFNLEIGGGHWRTNGVLFKDREGMGLQMAPGAACYSPCWYEQGHGPTIRPPGPSANLINTEPNVQLLRDTQDVMAIMGGVLSIIHPALFRRGMDAWTAAHGDASTFRNGDEVKQLLNIWATPFTAMSMISNRETPLHRDIMGGLNLFDALLTFGNYEEGRFELAEAGLRFRYDRGTGIFLESRSLQHGASAVSGERCCMVLFFRANMLGYKLPEGEKDPEEVDLPTTGDLRAQIRQFRKMDTETQ